MVSISQELRQAVLQAAIQGKLTEQLPEDGDAMDLLAQIKAEKERLIKEKKIKKEKSLEPITEDEVPFDIPENWKWVRIGSIFNVGTGMTPLKSDSRYYINGTIPWVNSALTSNRYIRQVDFYITECALQENSLIIYPPHTIIVAMYGQGKTRGQTSELLISATINQACAALDNILYYQEMVDYVYYYFQNNYEILRKKAEGTSQPNLNLQKIKKTIIPLPPLVEQKRIVSCVKEMMAKIDELEKIENDLLALYSAFPGDMKGAILQAAMQGKLTKQLMEDGTAETLLNQIKNNGSVNTDNTNFDLPDNWQWAVLCDVAEMYTGNSIAENEKTQKYVGLDYGYDYIGTKDVGFDHVIQYNNGVRIPYDAPKFKYAFPEATLLCIEGGSAGRKIAMLDRKVCFGNKLCMFYSAIIENKFLYYYLQSPDFQSAFKNNVSGIIGGVSINKLKYMPIPIPPLAEQHRIVERLDKLLPLCDSLQTEL